MSNTAKGKDLIFISRIERDGSGVVMIKSQDQTSFWAETEFELNRLSISENTWIASEFNSYVVKLKNDNHG